MRVLSVISALAVVAFAVFGWGTAIAEGGFGVVVNAVGIAGAFLLAVAVIFCLFFLVDAIASTVERALDVEPAPTLASRSILAVELGDSFFLEHKSDDAEGSGVVFESWNTNVVTVDSWGKVKAVGRGITMLTITVGDEPFAVVPYQY